MTIPFLDILAAIGDRDTARVLARAAWQGWVAEHVPNGMHWRDSNPPQRVLDAYALAFDADRWVPASGAVDKHGRTLWRVIKKGSSPLVELEKSDGRTWHCTRFDTASDVASWLNKMEEM